MSFCLGHWQDLSPLAPENENDCCCVPCTMDKALPSCWDFDISVLYLVCCILWVILLEFSSSPYQPIHTYIHTYIYIYIYTYYIYYFFLTENQRKPMTYPHSFQTALIHTNVSFLLAVLVLSNGYHLPCHSLLQTVNAACLLQWTFTSNHHLTLPQGVKGYVLGCLEQQSDNLWMVRPVLLCGVYFLPAILHIYCFYNKSIFKCYSGFLNLSIKIRQDLLQQDKCMLYKSHIFITIMYFFIIYKFL